MQEHKLKIYFTGLNITTKTIQKVLIAMSGGVDSSVAAAILKRDGCECRGAVMKLFDNETASETAPRCSAKSCCSLEDVEDARSVAHQLDIPFHVFNFIPDFRTQIIDRFIDAYLHGRTPNPCIDCNRFMKFEKFFSRMKELDYDFLATGHYARIEFDSSSNRFLLKKAVDDTKDQSYVLYTMTQRQLAHTKLPLGSLRKSEVREIADSLGFINAEKPDSQDLCFVPSGDYAEFIERQTNQVSPPGNFVDKTGKILGQHKGIIRYTIGQRKGLGIAATVPLYVCSQDLVANTVILGSESDLYTKTVIASDMNLIPFPRIDAPIRVKAKIRYRQQEDWATAEQTGNDTLRIEFDEPQKAVAQGQAVVLYDGDLVLGGGTIC